MNATTLLQWYYLIFVLPFGMAAVLILLSTLRIGHHGGHAGHGHGMGHTGVGHGTVGGHHMPGHGVPHGQMGAAHSGAAAQPAAHGPGAPHGAHASSTHPAHADSADASARGGRSQNGANTLWTWVGFGRAPLMLVLETFALAWGFCGFWANQMLMPKEGEPSLHAVLFSLAIACVGALIAARVGAEVIARVMPEEETLVVSRDSLFGLTGKIAYQVTETSGRIHIYDGYGTLHDESCRSAPGHPPIEKGRTGLVVDMNRDGVFIVEEIADTIG